MRCEECGRVMENAELWQIGGDRNAPTSRSMRQMCWECRTRYEPVQQKAAEPVKPVETEQATETSAPLSESVIADVNEAASAFESGAA